MEGRWREGGGKGGGEVEGRLRGGDREVEWRWREGLREVTGRWSGSGVEVEVGRSLGGGKKENN